MVNNMKYKKKDDKKDDKKDKTEAITIKTDITTRKSHLIVWRR